MMRAVTISNAIAIATVSQTGMRAAKKKPAIIETMSIPELRMLSPL